MPKDEEDDAKARVKALEEELAALRAEVKKEAISESGLSSFELFF